MEQREKEREREGEERREGRGGRGKRRGREGELMDVHVHTVCRRVLIYIYTFFSGDVSLTTVRGACTCIYIQWSGTHQVDSQTLPHTPDGTSQTVLCSTYCRERGRWGGRDFNLIT